MGARLASSFVTLALALSAYGHGVITAVQGENGVTVNGFGVSKPIIQLTPSELILSAG